MSKLLKLNIRYTFYLLNFIRQISIEQLKIAYVPYNMGRDKQLYILLNL